MQLRLCRADEAVVLLSVIVGQAEAVVAASDTDGLFHSPDPLLNTNKQAAYHIVGDLIEANHGRAVEEFTVR